MLPAILLAAFLAQAEEESGALLGPLGGARPALGEQGITVQMALTAEVLSNVSGGLDTGTRYEHLFDFVLDADLQKFLGWSGGSARVNPFWIEGQGVSRDFSGDLTKVSNIDARDEVRLFEAWLQQSAFDGRATLRAGLLAADQEFALTAYGPLFLNGSFGMPVLVSVNEPVPVYPLGAVGARLYVEPWAGVYGQVAVYDGHPGAEHENETGLRLRFLDADGVLSMVETGWRHGTGAVKLGAFLHSADFRDMETGVPRRGHHGFYGVVDQEIVPGAGAFVRVGGAPRDRSLLEFYVDGGVTVTGPIPGREQDVLGAAVIWARLSRDFADAQAAPSDWDHEIVLEVTYQVKVTRWLSVQPDLQRIFHPGGTSAVDDAIVVGLRIDLLF